MEPTFKTRSFIIFVPVSAGDLKPFKFKIPPEFIRINGFYATHDHYGVYVKGQKIPQIANLSLSFNNKGSNPINNPIMDNAPLTVSAKKITHWPLDERTRPGEYVEGFIEDFGVVGDYYYKIYLKGIVKYSATR